METSFIYHALGIREQECTRTRYEGSQFPEGAEAQTQFFCQMTPNTGNYDEALFGSVLSDVMKDVQQRIISIPKRSFR